MASTSTLDRADGSIIDRALDRVLAGRAYRPGSPGVRRRARRVRPGRDPHARARPDRATSETDVITAVRYAADQTCR